MREADRDSEKQTVNFVGGHSSFVLNDSGDFLTVFWRRKAHTSDRDGCSSLGLANQFHYQVYEVQ